jgi:hypothetical protein
MQYTYLRPETGEKELVDREIWRWEAHYTDGSILHQFDDENKSFHQIREIEQGRLSAFVMVHDEAAPIFVPIEGREKLIHYYLNTRLEAGTDNQTDIKQYVFGTEKYGTPDLLLINPDNSVIHIGKRSTSDFIPQVI